jgi:hypothetical protein
MTDRQDSNNPASVLMQCKARLAALNLKKVWTLDHTYLLLPGKYAWAGAGH